MEFTDTDAKSIFRNNRIDNVYENKLYYLKTAPEEKKITVYAYDIENKTTETVYEEYRDYTSLFSPQVVSVYGNNVFIQDFVMLENAAGCTFNISKLDLSTKTLEVIYTLGCFPVTEQGYLSVKNSGKYAFFEEWMGTNSGTSLFNIIRYDTQSGETVIFKENASKPVPHKDKLIYYRSGEEEQGLYCCDLESGENEQKICDLTLYDYSETICSDGEKIWVSPTVYNPYYAYHTIEYLDGDNNLVSVCRLSDCALDSIKYDEGYILSDGVFINAITGEIVYHESQGVFIKEHKLYAVMQTDDADEYKIYRLKVK